jgi:hypothetical protein
MFTKQIVPAGTYQIVVVPSEPDSLPIEKPGVVVAGGDTVSIDITP